MELTSATFGPNQRIPETCAFGIPDPDSHMRLGQNRNPQLHWSGIPDNARSLVLLCIDTDVPSALDAFNGTFTQVGCVQSENAQMVLLLAAKTTQRGRRAQDKVSTTIPASWRMTRK